MDKPLTQNIWPDRDFTSLADYQKTGGYQGMRKAITELQPDQVQQRVKDSGLRGRGGAGFSTGLKWSLVPRKTSDLPDFQQTRYFVANADEMEPGAFKDRLLLEQDPQIGRAHV